MFGIGMPELLLILAVALIVIGPKKLPGLAKSLGKAMGEFKRATNDLKETISVDPEIQDVKKAFDDMNTEVKNTFKDEPSKNTYTPPTDPEEKTPSEGKDPEPESGDALGDLSNAFKEMNTGEGEGDPEEVPSEKTADASSEDPDDTVEEKKSPEQDANV